jgi:hypothetical protein
LKFESVVTFVVNVASLSSSLRANRSNPSRGLLCHGLLRRFRSSQ